MTAVAQSSAILRRPSSRAWLTTAAWIACAALTAASLLRFSRNLRVTDTKGSAQYFAVDTPLGLAVSSDTASWLLFVDQSAGAGLSRDAVCDAVSKRGMALPAIRIVWTESGSLTGSPKCGQSIHPQSEPGSARKVASAMNRSHLALMLVNGRGRYVFGGQGSESDIAALSLFAERR